MVRIVRATQAEIDEAVTALRDGELVAFPTETVYGLGANAQNVDDLAQSDGQQEQHQRHSGHRHVDRQAKTAETPCGTVDRCAVQTEAGGRDSGVIGEQPDLDPAAIFVEDKGPALARAFDLPARVDGAQPAAVGAVFQHLGKPALQPVRQTLGRDPDADCAGEHVIEAGAGEALDAGQAAGTQQCCRDGFGALPGEHECDSQER